MNIAELHRLFLNSTGICTDTRKLLQGNLFFALRGENFNGNLYASAALEAGASYAVVDEPISCANDRCIEVENVLQTLQMLASFHRQHLNIPIVGITGTNGKTTTKELIFAVLSKKYVTVATQGNLNNHIGVPLTLLRMNKETQLGVVEMGANHPGEIAMLCAIARPNVGLVTNVGKAHLEGFGSFEGVKKTKGELYAYLAENQGKAIVWEENADLMQMIQESRITDYIPYSGQAYQMSLLPANERTPYLRFLRDGKQIDTQLVGTYNAPNVWAAMALGYYFEVPENEMFAAITAYCPQNHRSQWITTAHNQLIVDAYNANPSSMAAAIDNFEKIAAKHKMLILGEMLELGKDSAQEHLKIVQQVEKFGLEEVIFVGKNFCACPLPPKALYFDKVEEVVDYLQQHHLQQYLILIKGSRGVRLEKVLEAFSVETC